MAAITADVVVVHDTVLLENLVKDGILPPEYAASSDPQRLLHVIIKPEMVEILVAGDPGRNQSRAYMSNHVQGPPTSRRVELPRNWARLPKPKAATPSA